MLQEYSRMASVKMFKVESGRYINQCYLVSDGRRGVLIDPAWDFYALKDYIDKHHIQLQGVFLTHHHMDHVDLAESFALHYDVPVYMSQIEIDQYGFVCANLVGFEDRVPIACGQIEVLPIVTPGHTAGGCCYLIGDSLFTGDTVFIEGVGLTTTAGGNVHELYDSVRLLDAYLRGGPKVWPGHSYGLPPGQSYEVLLSSNVYFHLSRDEFVRFRMRAGQTKLFDFK